MTKEPPIRECLLEELHQAKIAPSDAQGSIRLLGSMLERCVQGTNENVTERVEGPDDGHVDATDSSAGSGVAALLLLRPPRSVSSAKRSVILSPAE